MAPWSYAADGRMCFRPKSNRQGGLASSGERPTLHSQQKHSPLPLVQVRRQTEQIQLGVQRRDTPLYGDAGRARHGEHVAVPRGLRGVGGQGAVRAVGVEEVGEEPARADVCGVRLFYCDRGGTLIHGSGHAGAVG